MDVRLTSSSISSTRRRGRPMVSAAIVRISRPVRPACWAEASRRTPTSRPGLGRSANRSPLMVAVPDVGTVRPTITRIVVDLPAPFGPRKPVTRPGRAVKETLSTAVKPAYLRVSDSTVIMGSTLAASRRAHIGVEAGPSSAVGRSGVSFFRSVPDPSAVPRLGLSVAQPYGIPCPMRFLARPAPRRGWVGRCSRRARGEGETPHRVQLD